MRARGGPPGGGGGGYGGYGGREHVGRGRGRHANDAYHHEARAKGVVGLDGGKGGGHGGRGRVGFGDGFGRLGREPAAAPARSRALYVGGVPDAASLEDLAALVEDEAVLESLRLVREKSCAFLNFLTEDIAEAVYSRVRRRAENAARTSLVAPAPDDTRWSRMRTCELLNRLCLRVPLHRRHPELHPQ